MRYRKHPNLKPTREDIALGWQLRNALQQTEDLPKTERWRMAMELLPDEYHYRVILARTRATAESTMSLYGILISGARMELEGPEAQFGPQSDMGSFALGIVAVPMSSLGELERRYKQFCEDVILMEDPFAFDPKEYVKYVPRDPENFAMETMRAYYTERAQALLK